MPTYQYACTACDHRFEAVQSFSDSSLTDCPECSGRLRKLYGAVGIVFKGSGFYRNDSRADSKSGSSKSSSSSSASGNGSGEAKKSGESSSSSSSSSDSSSTKSSSDSKPAAAGAASS